MKQKNRILRIGALGSLMCAAGLFFSPYKLMMLLVLAVAAAIGILILSGEPEGKSSAAAACCFTAAGMIRFYVTAQEFLANRVLLLAAAALLGAGGWYAMYRISGMAGELMARIFAGQPVRSRVNYGLILGGAAFFALASMGVERLWLCQSGVMALGMLCLAARYVPDAVSGWKDASPACRAWCCASAGGMGLFLWEMFPEKGIGAVLVLAAAAFFLYPMTAVLYSRLAEVACLACRGMEKREKQLYALLFAAFVVFTFFAFRNSEAFYGTDHLYDLIYTSDSPTLFRDENAYMRLLSEQNDLRQPLFAVFTAPLVGPAWLLARVIGAGLPLRAFLMNVPMLGMMFAAYFLIAKTLKLSSRKRMLFMVLCCSGYPAMLFSVMMEQYIPALFYLALLLFSVSEGRPDEVWFWGASGTMLTSAVSILLLNPGLHPLRDLKKLILQWIRQGLGFAAAIIAFGRLDVILGSVLQIMELRRFSGGITMTQKLYQYTAFFASCLTAPAAGPAENQWGILSWQLAPASGLHLLGICIAALCLAGALAARKQPGTGTALAWLGFSGVILLVLGWGCPENGLILYSLYFGWEILVLLFRLMESIRWPKVFACVYAAVLAAVLLGNLPAIARLVSFAVQTFPCR